MTSHPTFGTLLRQLRKRAGMTQGDLAAAVGYSVSFVSDLEQNRRLPAVAVVLQQFVPALGLQEEASFATRLVELAALARGECLPTTVTLQRTAQLIVTETFTFPSSYLPVPPTELIGREQEIKLLCNRLLGHSGRLLTLLGPPGVGKTRLGLAVASRLEPLFKDGAYFVPLAALSDPTLVAAELVATLPISDMSQRLPKAKLIKFLRRKELLLVLDNFEQITVASGLVAELLAECPGLRILITSRERLHLRAEQRYQVPPLALAMAVTLFTQRAQAVDIAFEPGFDQQPIIAALCQRLDCLPLAIELIAVHIDLFSPQVMLARLNDRGLDVLNDGAGDTPVHHRTLRNAIHRSYVLCNPAEQRLFRSLGVFVGGFDLAAVAGLGYAEQTLQALINRSMVRIESRLDGERRGLLLETLREYAREQLVVHQELPAVQQQHADYFLSISEGYNHVEAMPQFIAWSSYIERNVANIQAALLWAVEQRCVEKALRFINALQPFWFSSEFRLRTTHLYYAVIRLADEEWAIIPATLNGVITPTLQQRIDLLAHGLSCAGQAAMSYPWDVQESAKLLERSALLDRLTGIKQVTLLILLTFSRVERHSYNYERAVELCNRILGLLPTVVDITAWQRKWLKSLTLFGLLQYALESNDWPCLVVYFHQLMPLLEDLDDQQGLARLFAYQGDGALFNGEVKQAIEFLNRSLTYMKRKDSWLAYKVKYKLGIVALQHGELKKAQIIFVDYIIYRYSKWDSWEVSFGFWGLADLAIVQGQSKVAAQLLGTADHMQQFTHDYFPKLYHCAYAATIAAARTQLDEAAYASAYAEGYAMNADQAIAFVLAQFGAPA